MECILFGHKKSVFKLSVRCTKDNYLERSSLELNLTIIIMAIVQNLRNMERALDGNNNKI